MFQPFSILFIADITSTPFRSHILYWATRILISDFPQSVSWPAFPICTEKMNGTELELGLRNICYPRGQRKEFVYGQMGTRSKTASIPYENPRIMLPHRFSE